MSERQPPSEFTQAMVQGVGMLGLITGGTFLMRGLKTGSIQPAEILESLPRYRDAFLDALAPALATVAAVLIVVGIGVLTARHGRTLLAVWWRYNRRWAQVMAAEGLVIKSAKNVRIPKLHTVVAGPDADVVTVAMLPGQSAADWDARTHSLATAFGATAGAVRYGEQDRHLDLVFSRSAEGGGRPMKALPAPTPPPLAIPIPINRPRGDRVATVRAWGLQIGWALISTPDAYGHHTTRLKGSLRWARAQHLLVPAT
ncbi:hypothetical protein ACFWSP_40540 [Streptomyces sp. NPDC058618]|uniref:hypothetical protein n=1 Tax=Actinomycetes TaxID=1760 RepID=UPI00365D41CF